VENVNPVPTSKDLLPKVQAQVVGMGLSVDKQLQQMLRVCLQMCILHFADFIIDLHLFQCRYSISYGENDLE